LQNRPIDTERTLLYQIASGDQRSFTVLFEYYSKTVYPFALKLTRSEELAEEILQEVFLKIWINRQNLPEIENFGAYVNRMTRNYAYNVLRRIAHENLIAFELSQQLTEEVNDTEEEVNYKDLEHSLAQAISCLTPQQKLIYTLCHQQGLKYSEVAGRLNISSSTVHTHMKLALKFIRTYFIRINTLILFFSLFK
jgi:RNA polymerase sigma-70 factor (family 1)